MLGEVGLIRVVLLAVGTQRSMLVVPHLHKLVDLLRSSAGSRVNWDGSLTAVAESFRSVDLSLRTSSSSWSGETELLILSSRLGGASPVGLPVPDKVTRWSDGKLLLLRVLSVLSDLSGPSGVYLQAALSIAHIQTDVDAFLRRVLLLLLAEETRLLAALLDSDGSSSVHHELVDGCRFLGSCSVLHEVRPQLKHLLVGLLVLLLASFLGIGAAGYALASVEELVQVVHVDSALDATHSAYTRSVLVRAHVGTSGIHDVRLLRAILNELSASKSRLVASISVLNPPTPFIALLNPRVLLPIEVGGWH